MQQHYGDDEVENVNIVNILPKLRIQCHDKVRGITVITKEGTNRTEGFTPTEYKLLLTLLQFNGTLVTDTRLMLASGVRSPNLLIRHMENLRGKLRHLDLDIPRVAKYGFILIYIEAVEMEKKSMCGIHHQYQKVRGLGLVFSGCDMQSVSQEPLQLKDVIASSQSHDQLQAEHMAEDSCHSPAHPR